MDKIITLLKNWKTTAVGILPLIFGLLTAFGVINVDPQEAADTGISVLDAAIAFISSAVGLIGLFSKDGDKTSEEVGLDPELEREIAVLKAQKKAQ